MKIKDVYWTSNSLIKTALKILIDFTPFSSNLKHQPPTFLNRHLFFEHSLYTFSYTYVEKLSHIHRICVHVEAIKIQLG